MAEASALDFLRAFRPTGFWILTAILPDGPGSSGEKPTITRPFAVTEEAEAAAWIAEQNKTRNIYFSVNPTIGAVNEKASREQIAAMEYLHVDLDAHQGEDPELARARCLKSLTTDLPAGISPPTFVVDSGGGGWGFWRLEQPFQIGGVQAAYEEASRYNVQLEMLFAADHCHNVDRIARLPGTTNWPNEKKRKSGRVPRTAALVTHAPAHVYPIKRFTPAPLVQDAGFGVTNLVHVSGNVQRLASVDSLPEAVSKLCRVVIVQGKDPDNPDKWPSRSEALFWVCCELVRGGCDDDLIFSVITDPGFGISESVLAKGSKAEKYAIRQIERAREEAISPHLRALNERHAVIGDVDGKCRILSESFDETLGRSGISLQSFPDFHNRYSNQFVEQGSGEDVALVPLGLWWTRHAQRRSYEGITFAPGREIDGKYNLWKGFACDARPGVCERYLAHVRDNICCGDAENYEYLLGWMAMAVQHPDRQGHVAVVLRGKKGVGKGKFVHWFGGLFGRHYVPVTHAEHLVGKFNAHLRDCVVLFADEGFFAGDKRHESMLKSMVTEGQLIQEGKGKDAGSAKNYLHILMASNEDWVVPASGDERRFFVLDVCSRKMQDLEYFAAIEAEYENGGREALLHYLMNYDLSKYEVRRVPKTEALQEQKTHSFTPEQEWWYAKLMVGEVFEGQSWPADVFCTHLAHDFVSYLKTWSTYSRTSNSTRLGRFMSRVLPGGEAARKQKSGRYEIVDVDGESRTVDRPRIYELASLEECRANFAKEFIGGHVKWPAPLAITGQLPLTEEPY